MKNRTDRLLKVASGRKAERLALWCIRVLGALAVVLLALFFSGAFPQLYIGKGDLFRLSSIKKFDEEVAAPYRADESVHTTSLDSAVVWWIGDSFSRVQFGHKPLPEEVSDILSAAGMGKVSAVDYIDLQGSPKKLFALAASRAAAGLPFPKAIVIECVERNVAENFGSNTAFDYGDVAPWNEDRGLASKVKKWRRSWFMEAPGMVDFKLRRFPPVAAIRKVTDSWRYGLYGDYHPNAIAAGRSLEDNQLTDPILRFGSDDNKFIVGSNVDPVIISNLQSLDSFAKSFGSRLLLVVPPNRNFFLTRYTPLLYGIRYGVDSMDFEFYKQLDSAEVPYVNLHVPFLEKCDKGVPLYWSTDSHWNGNAHKIASDAISVKLKEMLK